jgi:hypothetical protein
MDADQLVIERLYQSLKAQKQSIILPLVNNIANPSPNLGWQGLERKSLLDRGKPELTLCLALLHHVVISANIPLTSDESRSITIDKVSSFGTIDPAAKFIPSRITDRVFPLPTTDTSPPLSLAIAVNGTIQAVTRTWKFPVQGERGRWSALVKRQAFRPGANEVEAFVIIPNDAGPGLAKTKTASYHLSEVDAKGRRTIRSADTSFPIVEDELNGWVGLDQIDNGHVVFHGWAVDEKRNRVPDQIVIFVNNQFFFSSKPYMQRPDIVEWLKNLAFEYSGFYYTFQRSSFPHSPDLDVRFFALSQDGVASELHYEKGYPWRKNS